jgi:hypothetical protein
MEYEQRKRKLYKCEEKLDEAENYYGRNFDKAEGRLKE